MGMPLAQRVPDHAMPLRRRGLSRPAEAQDRWWGEGTAARRLAVFERLMHRRGAALTDMVDWWTTAYAALLEFSEAGLTISPRGWGAARDHLRRWAWAQHYWVRSGDGERQEVCERIALAVALLWEERAVGLAVAERAEQALRDYFVASERVEIERHLRLP